jgi:hypothetical protein
VTESIVVPDWIYPGAKVYVVTRRIGTSEDTVHRAVINKVHKKSFTLVGTDERLSLADFSSNTSRISSTSYLVLDPRTREAQEAWARERVRRVKVKATQAAYDWYASRDRTDLDKLDATIAALTAWREMVIEGRGAEVNLTE